MTKSDLIEFSIDPNSETLAEEIMFKLLELLRRAEDRQYLVRTGFVLTVTALILMQEQKHNTGREVLSSIVATLQAELCSSLGYPKAHKIFKGLLGDGDD